MKLFFGRTTLGVGLLIAAMSGMALGQADVQRFERQLEQIRRETVDQANQSIPAEQRALLDYGMYISAQYMSIDDSDANNHTLRQVDIYPWVRANFDGAHEVFLRGRATYRDYSPGDSFDGLGDRWINPDLDTGYYRFDLQRYLATSKNEQIDNNLIIEAGRDLAYVGNGMVLSEIIDGLLIGSKLGPVNLDFLAGITPTRTVDIDSSRPEFDFDTRRGFYGVTLSSDVGVHRPYIYGLMQQDYNDDHNVSTAGGVTTVYEYNSFYIGVGSNGSLGDRILYGVEAIYQGGTTLSNSFVVTPGGLAQVPQTEDDIHAFGADAKIDYLFADPRNSRVGGEVILATGDRDRLLNTTNTFGGNLTGTNDHSFNAFGLLNTGLAFAPNVSNVAIFRVGASTFPAPDVRALSRMQVGADFFVFSKFYKNAPIDEPTAGDNEPGAQTHYYLGVEPDVYINWQITSDVSLALRYGIFFPSSNNFANDEVRQFIFAGVTYSF